MTNASKKRVSFNRNVRGVAVKSIYDYTAKEIKACWYNVEELEKIAERCVKILHHFENGKNIKNGKRYCLRGLEAHSTKASMGRREIRHAARKAVLEQQARQMKNGSDKLNWDDIADAYQRISATSLMRAQVMGSLDKQVAGASESQEFTLGIPAPPCLKVAPSPDMRIRRKNCDTIARVERGARAA